MFTTTAILAAFTAAVSALSVTSPSLGQSIPQSADLAVTWATVSSDQQSFNIQLAISTDSGNARTLTTNVSPSTNGFSTPASAFTPGNYTINLVGNSQTSSGVLAQSGWFLITAAQVSSSSASASSSAAGGATSGAATGMSSMDAATSSAASAATGASMTASGAGNSASGSAVSLGSGTVSGSTLGASAASSAASRASTAAGSATSRAAAAAVTAVVGTLGSLVAGVVALAL